MFTVERPGAQATRYLDSYYSNLANNENNRAFGFNRSPLSHNLTYPLKLNASSAEPQCFKLLFLSGTTSIRFKIIILQLWKEWV
jgi:hypothetical protein